MLPVLPRLALHCLVGLRGDLVANVPELFVEKMFHPLVKDFDRCAHSADHSPADDSLSQFQVMIAKQLDAFVEIQQPFCSVVQAKKFLVSPVHVIDRQACSAHLLVERLTRGAARCEASQESRENLGRCHVRVPRESSGSRRG